MKYAVEMYSDAMIYIPKFYKDRYRYSKVDREIHRHPYGDCISLLLFFQNKESRLKICIIQDTHVDPIWIY
jgi:hypothetical protein